jgi:hypothetical protein
MFNNGLSIERKNPKPTHKTFNKKIRINAQKTPLNRGVLLITRSSTLTSIYFTIKSKTFIKL